MRKLVKGIGSDLLYIAGLKKRKGKIRKKKVGTRIYRISVHHHWPGRRPKKRRY